MSRRSVATADLLERPDTLLTSSHLAEFAEDYRRLIAESTYADNRVR